MLGFALSTLAFSIAVYGLNRLLGVDNAAPHSSRKTAVIVLATVLSIGVGWLTDKLDGDANKPQKTMLETIQSGDPALIAKMLIGIN